MKPKKVIYEYIANDASRKASLKKRRAGLLKKIEELTTLCDVRACGIIYSPGDPQPIFWPSREEVVGIIKEFQQLPKSEMTKKQENLESYLRDKIKKMADQLQLAVQRNKEMEMSHMMRQIHISGKTLDEFSSTELYNFEDYAKERLTLIQKKQQFFKQVATLRVAGAAGGSEANQDQPDVGHDVLLPNPIANPNPYGYVEGSRGIEDPYAGSSSSGYGKGKGISIGDHGGVSSSSGEGLQHGTIHFPSQGGGSDMSGAGPSDDNMTDEGK